MGISRLVTPCSLVRSLRLGNMLPAEYGADKRAWSDSSVIAIASTPGRGDTPSSRSSVSPSPAGSKLQRKSLIEAVAEHGGHAAGVKVSKREACRRFIATMRWQIFLLAAALIDLAVLINDLYKNDKADIHLSDVTTAVVLAIFAVDIVLRLFTFRSLFFRFFWNWFDLIVVVLSLGLLITEVTLQSITKASSTAVVLARASRAGKTVILSLRWARAVRAMRLLSKVGTGSAQAMRHTTGCERPFSNSGPLHFRRAALMMLTSCVSSPQRE